MVKKIGYLKNTTCENDRYSKNVSSKETENRNIDPGTYTKTGATCKAGSLKDSECEKESETIPDSTKKDPPVFIAVGISAETDDSAYQGMPF